ncbi:zinc finger, CCHC-type containing protein [Tanacetum coccineum]
MKGSMRRWQITMSRCLVPQVDPNDPYEPAGPTDEPKLADNPTDMEPTDRLIGMNQLELVDGPDPADWKLTCWAGYVIPGGQLKDAKGCAGSLDVKEAINDEMDSIMDNNTWVLADLPPGIDYFDTYALVACISTIRLLIAMTSIHNLIIHQMDMKTAFLNGDLDEEFDEVVLSNGYLLNQADKCVYSKFDETGKGVIICLYVDDMLIFGTDQVQVDLTKEFLLSRFSMKDMGEADVILGIRIKHESNGIAISQSHYIEKVLKKFNYFDCTPVSTPMDTSEKLMPNNGQAVSQLEYSRVIGCLMYAITCTRPDIAFAVGKLSKYTSNPGTQHWQAIQRVLKYLKKTMDFRLTYIGYPSVLEGYTDASWISNTEDNSSTSG